MTSAPPRSSRTPLIATLVAMAVIVGCVVGIVLGATRSETTASSALTQDRAAVLSQANAFVTAEWTYDVSMLSGAIMPAYRTSVEAVVTPKFSQTFEQYVTYTEKAVAQASLKSTVKVWKIAVSAVSADKATVLVVGSHKSWVPKSKGSKEYSSLGEEPFRLVISLVKVGGIWRVDSQAPAEGTPSMAAPGSSGSATGTATPTASSTPSASATSGASK